MALLDEVNAINTELEQIDSEFGIHDRGQFYVQQYKLTTSEAVLLEGHISTFSGVAGGNAYGANYLLAEMDDHPDFTAYGYTQS